MLSLQQKRVRSSTLFFVIYHFTPACKCKHVIDSRETASGHRHQTLLWTSRYRYSLANFFFQFGFRSTSFVRVVVSCLFTGTSINIIIAILKLYWIWVQVYIYTFFLFRCGLVSLSFITHTLIYIYIDGGKKIKTSSLSMQSIINASCPSISYESAFFILFFFYLASVYSRLVDKHV